MKFFGRKSAGRADVRPALSRGFSLWNAASVPRTYEERVREGYLTNPVAQRAVRMVAEGVAQAPLSATDMAVLPLIRATTAGQGLLETVAMQLLLHGNAYVQVLCGADGRPAELFALRPERVGGRDWRLRDLWRGRRGREEAVATHAIGSSFTLLEASRLKIVEPRFAVAGVKFMAVGVGDPVGVQVYAPPRIGLSTLPLSPVGLAALASGTAFVISWIRRSRDGWFWRDSVDVPLAEQVERYLVTKRVVGRADRSDTVDGTAWTYSDAELSADRGAGATQAIIEIRQVGTFGLSPAASITIAI